MDSQLSVFKFDRNEVRTVQEESGEVHVVAKDVSEALGYSWEGKKTVKHVPEEWRGVYSVSTPSGVQEMITLSEQGLYFFLARSDKPKAIPFQKWIAGDVLPSIRKHGAYMTPQTIEDMLTNPDMIIQLATKLKEEQQARKNLEAEKQVMLPKVEAYETLMTGVNTLSIGDLAKAITHTPAIGRGNMFKFLKSARVLMDNTLPFQTYRDRGYFEVIAVPKTGFNNGETMIFEQTRATAKGIDYVRKLVDKHYDAWRKATTKGMN